MLIELEAAARFTTGAVLDAFAVSLHAIKSLLDLPVAVHSLESTLRFVKTSGFEDPSLLMAATGLAAGKGIPIGAGRSFRVKSGTTSSSASSVSGKKPQWEQPPASSSSSETKGKSGFASIVPRAMTVFLIFDVLLMVIAKQSSLNACVSKLGIVRWVLGGILLGFPATWLVDSVRHEYSFRHAFVTEMFLLLGSFVWLCYGGSMIFNAVNACVDTIAPLWWLSYASSVLSLSVAGTVIFCMVVTTVLSLIYGSATAQAQ